MEVLRSRRMALCSTAQQFGRFVTFEIKTGEQRQRPTTGSAFTVTMSSPALGGKRSRHRSLTVSFMATGDTFVYFIERRGLGISHGTAKTSSKKFLKLLAAVLFQSLVPERLQVRGCAGGASLFPSSPGPSL